MPDYLGRVASIYGARSLAPLPKRSRRRCRCGQPATHHGLADGVALMRGCEWCVRRWVRDPYSRIVQP